MSKCLIIAEVGVNHNGNIELAFQLIDKAKQVGADIVKFQTFNPKKLSTGFAQKANYQKSNNKNDENQLSMLEKLQLSYEVQKELFDYAKEKDIEFLSSPFDSESADWLVNSLGLSTIKVGSGELTNGLMLLQLSQKNVNIILSTGMSTLEEVEESLGVLAFGYLNPKIMPDNRDQFLRAYNSQEGKNILREKVIILHCTTEYPAPFEEVNLRCMAYLRDHLQLKIGFSDHTSGISIPVAAVALGAEIIEKHFTLDNKMEGPDHKASLNPKEFSEMTKAIREVEMSLGKSEKKPTRSELANMKIARKSIVAAVNIKSGEVFTANNLTVKRPGTGLSPMNFWNLLGKNAKRNFVHDEIIEI